MSDIQSKVLIVRPSISQVGKSKTDKEITAEVHNQHGVEDESGQYVKKLWPKEFIAPFTKIVGEASRYHKRHTVVSQFGDLIPTVQFERYREAMDAYIQQFNDAADDFAANYDAIIERARQIHNGTFKEEFYPIREKIREEFSFTLFTAPVPRTTDLSVSYIDEERIVALRAEIEQSVSNAGKMASAQVIKRILECVNRIAVTLGDQDAIFRNSMIDNLKEMLNLAPALNIADDPAVTQLIHECATKLVKDPDSLRNSSFQRKTTAVLASQIAETFGKMGGRKLAA